jgi:hypothetical protein
LPPAIAPDLSGALRGLLERRLLVFLGKGGVGKSTLTAAVGRLLAARGRKVLLCEVNAPADPVHGSNARLPPALGVTAPPPEISEVLPNLFLCNIQPEAALYEYVLMKLKIERAVKKLLGNGPVRSFLRMIPSLSEVVTLGKLLHHVREQRDGGFRFDAVLLDAPSTGHGVSLLNVPQVLLNQLPSGPMREDLSWMNALLVDRNVTAVQLVTLAEELPVSETLELNATLRDELALPRGLCFANGIWPSRFDSGELRELDHRTPPAVFETARRLQAQAEVNRHQLARLREGLDLPVLELPQIFPSVSPRASRDAGPAEVTTSVAAQLEKLFDRSAPPAREGGRRAHR